MWYPYSTIPTSRLLTAFVRLLMVEGRFVEFQA